MADLIIRPTFIDQRLKRSVPGVGADSRPPRAPASPMAWRKDGGPVNRKDHDIHARIDDDRARRSSHLCRLVIGTCLLVAFPAGAAVALSVKDCRDAGVGIESIVTPVEKSHIALYDGKVDAYKIDTVEPACCSSGVAVVLPAKDDPSGGSSCWAVIGLASVDVTSATRSYDKVKGLLLVLPAQRSNPNGDRVQGPPLKLRINLRAGSVSLE